PATDGNFYYCEVDSVTAAKYIVKVSLPFTIKLNMTTYTASSGTYKGNSSVAFSYTISQNGVVKASWEYDIVSFNAKVASSPAFHVGGRAPNALPSDVENVFTGFAGGAEVIIAKISATMQLEYLSGASLVPVTHAYGNGGETGETVQNVHMIPASGNSATAESGTDDSVQLW
ncbi:MAG: thermopsin family protease, partial [Thaumarchaeota archaeon]|nr:thermopsin family protease [Nitrososphaerota archaeon]